MYNQQYGAGYNQGMNMNMPMNNMNMGMNNMNMPMNNMNMGMNNMNMPMNNMNMGMNNMNMGVMNQGVVQPMGAMATPVKGMTNQNYQQVPMQTVPMQSNAALNANGLNYCEDPFQILENVNRAYIYQEIDVFLSKMLLFWCKSII